MNTRPRNMLILAFFMLLAGAVVPFLMVIGLVESTFVTNILAYSVSVAGLFIGVLGIATFVGDARRSKDDDDWPDDWRER